MNQRVFNVVEKATTNVPRLKTVSHFLKNLITVAANQILRNTIKSPHTESFIGVSKSSPLDTFRLSGSPT